MDTSLLLLLSNLLHLHFHHLDSSTHPSSATLSLSLTSSSAPLLFFTLSSVLSVAAAAHRKHKRKTKKKHPSSPTPFPPSPSTSTSTTTTTTNSANPQIPFNSLPSDHSLDAFRSLTSNEIWSVDHAARDSQWRSSYGLSYPVFASLVDQLKPFLEFEQNGDDVLSLLPPDYAVAIALSRLTHGYSSKILAAHYKIPARSISKLTNTVTRILATKLYPNYVRTPVGHRLLETIQAFRETTGLSNLCGAIDGSHVKVPRVEDESFRCRYGFHSVLLQVVSDQRKIFWDVCVKAGGSTDDAAHFRDSSLYKRLTSAEILRDSVINVRGHHVRPYIIGDWCFPLLSFLLTPFTSNSAGTPAQNFFDASLMRGRSVVESAVCLLKGRWKIMQNLNVGLQHAPQTVVACCVLHNICQIAGEPEPVVVYKEQRETGPPARPLESEKSYYYFGESLRQAIADDLQERQQQIMGR